MDNTMGKIAVLCGGDGAEREVSLRSGAAIHKALEEAGLQVEKVDLTSLDQVSELIGFGAAFIAMHGDWGEDGQLQERLELTRLRYTGSGPEACELAMDKWRACDLFRRAGLRVPRGFLLTPDAAVDAEALRASLGSDIVVKPCRGGSTVGVTILRGADQEALAQAVDLARRSYGDYDPDVLCEEYIEGRELTVAVWERDGVAEALPVIEIVPKAGFYDYSNKYTSGATDYLVPAPLAPETAGEVADAAVRAHRALGCLAYSRVDIRLSPEGVPYVLEVNTAPGMTETSLVPKAARAAGMSLSEFALRILRMGR